LTWRAAVSQTVGAARVSDIQKYVTFDPRAASSPIDSFYEASQALVKLGTPAALGAEPALGPLLLVGLVSAAENYFRDLFARTIQLCPNARAAASDENVKLGSVVWHSGGDAIRSAFEHISFADGERLLASCKKYLNLQLQRTGIVGEFDKVCQLRHGIVHAGSILGGKNATVLSLPATRMRLRIAVGFDQLQEAADICTSLVGTINSEAFAELCKRWAVAWPKLPTWNPKQRHVLFRSVWAICYSRRDANNGTIATPMTMVRCRNAVLREFT
jgi:hypothetical protein